MIVNIICFLGGAICGVLLLALLQINGEDSDE